MNYIRYYYSEDFDHNNMLKAHSLTGDNFVTAVKVLNELGEVKIGNKMFRIISLEFESGDDVDGIVNVCDVNVEELYGE